MKVNKIDKIVLLLICISLSVGLITIYQRVNIEKQYNTAEIVLDYEEMLKFSESSGQSLGWWFENFKDYGANSVAIQEETINLLIKKGKSLRADIVSEMIKNYNWENNYSEEVVSEIKNNNIDLYDAIITTKDKNLYEYIVNGLDERYSEQFYKTYSSKDEYYIVLNGNIEDIYYGNSEKVITLEGKGVYENRNIVDSRLFNIGIGYDEEKINQAKNSGLDVVLRPINYPSDNKKLADVFISSNEKFGLVPRLYIVHGKEILGYPENEDKLLNYINEYNIVPVLIESATQREHLEQDGLNKLVEKSNYNSLRAFTMWDYIRGRYKYYNYEGAEEIENTMFRAITERNIRVIYFKPFFIEEGSSKYLTNADEYKDTFDSLTRRLEKHDIKLGQTKSINEFHIGAKRISILSFGIVLAAVFLFIKMFNIKNKHFNLLYLFAVPGAIVPMVMRNIAEKGYALVAAVVFSGIAIYYFMTNIKDVFDSSKSYSNIQLMIKSSIILTISVIISLVGAVFVDSMLSDVRYMLEMDIFRGVKLSQIVPFGVFLVIYLVYFLNKNNENAFKSSINIAKTLLNKDIKIYYAIIAGLIGIVGYVYISRTGHETNLQPSNIEMIFRNFMENVLLARPRTKEFLIAFPAIFAAVFSANKKSDFFTGIFMLTAAIGTSSVINTFSHIRTPIYLSVARTFIGLGFGIIIGCIAILLMNYIYLLHKKIQERLN
ncbi:hypothetical protein J2Z76_001993 [Sedimentibacter acidaminivorans]|jgi:uncharacterized protein DUF5693|uniref:Uncharacterized protein n=1 Tax=Sedimentibacter acidaminivorans TaxID=913099 RepID=A0ABS4GEL5_9FIRM|nr:DUF5693 family protein [Sedimentibacter acidaminivorans]MBP1926129.1 hypothetical protein [Sedimentibacter acidaminivorans]